MRWVRFLSFVFFVVLLLILVRAYVRHQQRMNEPSFKPTPAPTVDWIEGLEFTVPEHFTLHAASYRPIGDGRFRLRGIAITVQRKSGDTVHITAPQGEWREGTGQLHLQKNVRIELERGIVIETTKGVYQSRRHRFQSMAPAHWTWPKRRLRGQSNRLVYDEIRRTITSSGGTEIVGVDRSGHQWMLQTVRAQWNLDTGVLSIPTTAHLVRTEPRGFEIICPHMLRQPDTPYGDVVRGWPFCTGVIGRKGKEPRTFHALEVLLLMDRQPRRVIMIQGRIEVARGWEVRGSPIAVETAEKPGWLKVFSPALLTISPRDEQEAIRRIRTRELLVPVDTEGTDAVTLKSGPGPRENKAVLFPVRMTVTLDQGILEAEGGRWEDTTMNLDGPIRWAHEDAIIRAAQAVRQDDRWRLEGEPGDGPVVGELKVKDGSLKIEAKEAVQISERRWRWGENVRMTREDAVFEAETFEWSVDTERWTLERVTSGRIWRKRQDRMIEISLTAGRMRGRREESCIILGDGVDMTLMNLAEEGPIRMMGRKGRWCPEGWSIRGNATFEFRDIRGQGNRIYGNLDDGIVWVEGAVQVTQHGGPRLKGRKLRLDVDQRRIEVINPWPERGELVWSKSGD